MASTWRVPIGGNPRARKIGSAWQADSIVFKQPLHPQEGEPEETAQQRGGRSWRLLQMQSCNQVLVRINSSH